MKSSQKGFTLLELLIVIAIIGILSTIVLASLNSARIKGRNAQRISDIKQLLNAFNLGLANTSLPSTSGGWACVSTTCSGGFSFASASPTVDAYIDPYIKKTADPSDSTRGFGGYLYNSDYAGTIGTYDGYIFTQGAYLYYMMEPPANSTSCGAGHIFSASSTYTECFAKIN